ncbi:MAG: hypothetical protein U0103_00740 [Candidatus Obscuribacterales bacterium]|nr:hypothetical protein [Cyanobacteria bacterium SZAS LIN-5]
MFVTITRVPNELRKHSNSTHEMHHYRNILTSLVNHTVFGARGERQALPKQLYCTIFGASKDNLRVQLDRPLQPLEPLPISAVGCTMGVATGTSYKPGHDA